jgi:hypothetical protein
MGVVCRKKKRKKSFGETAMAQPLCKTPLCLGAAHFCTEMSVRVRTSAAKKWANTIGTLKREGRNMYII